MIDLSEAVQFVLKQEDEKMTGEITNIKGDAGGRTRWGIAERSHPELIATGFYTSMSAEASLAVATKVYIDSYALPVKLTSLASQLVANAYLSFAINQGSKSATKQMQNAVNFLLQGQDPPQPPIVVDGAIGPATLAAINALPERSFLTALGLVQRQNYRDIVASNPSDAKFLNGWINRANASTTGQLA